MKDKAWKLRSEQWAPVIADSKTNAEAGRRLGVAATTVMRYRKRMGDRGLVIIELHRDDERISDEHLFRTFKRMRDAEIASRLECLREFDLLLRKVPVHH